MAFVDRTSASIDTLCGVIKGNRFISSLPRNANGVKNKVTVEVAHVTHHVLCHIASR